MARSYMKSSAAPEFPIPCTLFACRPEGAFVAALLSPKAKGQRPAVGLKGSNCAATEKEEEEEERK